MCKEIYFAAGCFWGAEKYLKLIRGVMSTDVGFANGNTPDPTYKEVYTDTTGYAECVHVTYDPQVIAIDKLTRIYFKAIDPTSLNKQGEDEGTRYRTGVYYAPDTDAETVELLQQVFKEQQQALDPGQKLAITLTRIPPATATLLLLSSAWQPNQTDKIGHIQGSGIQSGSHDSQRESGFVRTGGSDGRLPRGSCPCGG